jgi:hypothetical protein
VSQALPASPCKAAEQALQLPQPLLLPPQQALALEQ